MPYTSTMKKIQTHVHLDNDLYKWVCKQAKLRRCSISQLVRTLIAKEMARSDSIPQN